MIANADMEYINGQMVTFMRDNFSMIIVTDKGK